VAKLFYLVLGELGTQGFH